MLTTAQALAAVLANVPEFAVESIAAVAAGGRILRQTVTAERDQPPFDRVMMDGIAISSADVGNGLRRFEVQAMQAAGDPALTLKSGRCIEIMTGAARPENADCIVPVERINIVDGIAEIDANYDAKAMRHIHLRGSDFGSGAHLLTPGKRISALDVAVIASCGESYVDVALDPVVRIVSTGNELVPAGQPIAAHQVRMSNGPSILALLNAHGFRRTAQDHIADDIDELRTRLANHLEQADVVVLSGGVSMGKADYVPQVLGDLGVNVVFHRVSQKPGKPMWFGKGPKKQVVFALPGNPVSALVCCRHYVIPALRKASAAIESPPEFAALASNVSFKPDLTCFQPAKLISNAAGQLLAMPVKTNTSGDFASLSGTDGYVELGREQTHFPAGSPVIVQRWIAA